MNDGGWMGEGWEIPHNALFYPGITECPHLQSPISFTPQLQIKELPGQKNTASILIRNGK